MFTPKLNRRLSPEDSAFLTLETPESPMNIGSVAVFEGEIPFERFLENIAARIHLVPRCRQVVVPAPYNIGRPTWEFDPNFDIRRHVLRVRIDPPGTEQQLAELAGRIYSGMLDRSKPLWEMHFVEGMKGRTAVISKVHHCLVDGVGGVELLVAILDVSPEPPTISPPPPFEPPPMPSAGELFAEALFDCLSESMNRLSLWQRRLVDLDSDHDDGWLHAVTRAVEAAFPYFTRPVLKAPFNGPMRGDRRLAFSSYPFEEVRAMRGGTGATVNDVVLAVLGGAMARYLREKGEPTEGRELRVVVPVNVRRADERGTLGNRISMLLVEVPMSGVDPVGRLKLIKERMERLKRDNIADGVETIADLLLGAPMPLLAGFASLGPLPNWVANMVCTNVPGPMIPLYTVGHRLLDHYAIAPLPWEMGLGCAATSYNQRLYFTIQGDGPNGDDVDRVNELLRESYLELRAATIGGAIVREEKPSEVRPAPGKVAAA